MCRAAISNMRNFFTSITVEPSIFLFVFASELAGPAVTAFIYQKNCIELFRNDTHICDSLHNKTHKAEEDMVQTESSHWIMYQTYILCGSCISMAYIYGIVGDLYSQRLAICIPLMMAAIQGLLYIILSLESVYPLFPVQLFLLPPFVMGLGGSWPTFFGQALSYVATTTTAERRTERMALANGMYNMAAIISFTIGGVLLDNTSFTFVFSCAFALLIIAVIYTFMRIKNTRCKTSYAHASFVKNAVLAYKDSLQILCKKRPNNRGRHIILTVTVSALILFGASPHWLIGYLYLKRQPLSWSQSLYGYFVGYRNVIEGFGSIVMIPFIKRYANVPDTVMLGAGLTTSGASLILTGLSSVTFFVFIAALIGVFQASMWITVRTVMSYLVETEETGRIYAVMGTVQTVVEIFATTIYNNIYPLTLTFWAGTCYGLGGTVLISTSIIVCFLHHDIEKRGGLYKTLPNVDILMEDQEKLLDSEEDTEEEFMDEKERFYPVEKENREMKSLLNGHPNQEIEINTTVM